MYEEKFCSDESFGIAYVWIFVRMFCIVVVVSSASTAYEFVESIDVSACVRARARMCSSPITYPSNFLLESLSCCWNEKTETKCFRAFKRFSDFNFLHEHATVSFVSFLLSEAPKFWQKIFFLFHHSIKYFFIYVNKTECMTKLYRKISHDDGKIATINSMEIN